MSNPPSKQPAVSPAPKATTDDQEPVALPFDEQMRVFWEKNHKAVYVACVLIMLAMVGRYAYDELAVRREAGIEAAFAAATTPARIEAFARSHDNHPLAGAAWLKLADDAYAAGSYAEAITRYERAAEILRSTPFGARALLGKAVAQIQSGKTEEGTAALRKLADDQSQFRGIRCEAAYHLATLAFDAGSFDEVVKRTDQVMQLDSTGAWAQRAVLLRARMPVTAGAPSPLAPPATAAPKPAGP